MEGWRNQQQHDSNNSDGDNGEDGHIIEEEDDDERNDPGVHSTINVHVHDHRIPSNAKNKVKEDSWEGDFSLRLGLFENSEDDYKSMAMTSGTST